MTDWRDEIENAINSFLLVAEIACDPISRNEIEVEYLSAPHRPPTRLPINKMAVYGFWGTGRWLKIGKVGPNSNARYISQHYNAGSAQSTLAASLATDPHMLKVSGFYPHTPGTWIKEETCRVNILLPAHRQKELLALLEAFLHLKLKPRYEG